MEITPVLGWSLVAVLAVVALQSLLVAAFVLSVNTRLLRMYSKNQLRLRKLTSFLATAEETLVRVQAVTGRLAEWEGPLREAAGAASSALVEVDQKSERALSYLETNLEQWQAQSDDLIGRLAVASEEVYQAVLQPAARASLVLRSVGTGLRQLLSESETDEDPSHYHQDQQIFI